MEEIVETVESTDNETIDTSKLKIGMTVKNYRVLCELLGEAVKAGDSRKAQLKNFARFFDWEKIGQKFIISDIYTSPLDKEDGRKSGNNSIYVKCIEVILLQYLSKQDGYMRTLTKRDWWELLGIINHKYGKVLEKDLQSLDSTVTSWEVKHFYQRCNKKLEQILFSSLNSLKSRKLITYEIQTIISQKDAKGDWQYFEANDDQKKKILEMEHYVLHVMMGYEKMFQVFISFRQAEFYRKVTELLRKKYGWNHYFKQIKIIYTPEGVKDALPELTAKLRFELNGKVVNYFNSNTKEIYEKSKEKSEQDAKLFAEKCWGEAPPPELVVKSNVWDIPSTYVTAQNILTNELIKIGHKDMTFSSEDFLDSNFELDETFEYEKMTI